MAMAVDNRQQSHFPSMGYDNMRYHPGPQFTNPWVSAPASSTQGQMYATAMPASTDAHHRYAQTTTTGSHVASAYAGGAGAAPADGLHHAAAAHRSYNPQPPPSFTTAPPPAPAYAPTSAPQYSTAYGYTSADRNPAHPLHNASEAERQSFSDALDASRGMVAMSQSDVTPRNIYGPAASSATAAPGIASSRASTDSYGFPPSSHSSRSSISSASTYPSYYNSSVSEASVGDYSSASESVDLSHHSHSHNGGSNARTLPRPHGALLGGNLPPAPASMMGQFSSKVSSSSQKKHKCKICDKRFTRPSSLQTHMYSHTGEKPFACEVEGCGRHFSVVSNLRRHRKVHKGEGGLDHPSPDDEE